MKKARIIVYLLILGGLTSCDGEDKGPTTFQGEVVFPEGYEQISNAKVYVSGTKSRGTGTPSDNIIDTLVNLDENYRFQVTLPAIDVQYYTAGIGILNTSGVLEELLLDGDGMDCAGCNKLQPGETYNLTIEVLE